MEHKKVIEKIESACLWRNISSAPKDGTKIIGWLVPNEVNVTEKAKPWIMWWEIKQWKDAEGKNVGQTFGMWVTEDLRDPMSYAPTHWAPNPISEDNKFGGLNYG